jgi:methyl-accepting chemotaxis protein
MPDEPLGPKASTDEKVLQQQYLRALSSFEGIILGQIDIKNKLGNRLNYSIRAGLLILSAIAISILVLLLTLSAQINRISAVVADMNTHFTAVSDKMDHVRSKMITMDEQAAALAKIAANIASMEEEMRTINIDLDSMQLNVAGISRHVTSVHTSVANVSAGMDRMNLEVQAMSGDIHRMGKPARTMNQMFPFP